MSFRSYYIGNDWRDIRELYGYYFVPVILTVCGLLLLRRALRTNLKLPPGPMGLPLVGYLPFLGEEPFKTLDNLRKKYGNVFSFYLGQTYVVVLGDYAAVKEAFSKPTTLDRPPHIFDFIPDGGGLSGANGEEWVQQRRYVLKTMKDIGLGRSKWAHLVEDELSDFLKVIASTKGQAVDIKDVLSFSVTNNISSLVFGERIPPGADMNLLNSTLDSIMLFFSASGLWNFFPKLCNILVTLKIGSFYKSFREMSIFNDIIKKQIDLHRKPRSGFAEDNFVTDYIAAMQTNREKEKGFTERNLIANTRALYIAGSDTTKTALIWLFLAMAAHPDIQEKVQLELDRVLGKHQRATWEDRLKFPYTYAVILEAQRWQTIVPINVLRMATEDTKICGYDIPKGATIMANNWGLHNDPRYWKEPGKFIAERFLQDGENTVNVKKESYVPFSYGKRMCPGETVAMMEIFLYFTAIVQQFNIRVTNGGKPKLDGVLGITYQPLPHKLCFVLRQNKGEDI